MHDRHFIRIFWRVKPLAQLEITLVQKEREALGRERQLLAGEHLAGFSIQDTKHLRKRVLSGELKINFPIHSENPFKRKAINEFKG